MQDESLLGAVCSPVTSSTGIINMTDQQKLYEIRYSPLHGHGVFAKVDIKKNKPILKEAPLWSLKPEEGDKIRELAGSGDPPKLTKLGHYFTKLPGSSRTILYKLHGFEGISSRQGRRLCDNNKQRLGELALEAYVSNALGRDREAKQGILYDEVSRFNHSCELSAEYRVSDTDASIIVAAARAIKAGEEITLQYTKPLDSYDERAQHLKKRYGFACSCRLCTADQEERDASNARRKQLGVYQQELTELELTLRTDSRPPVTVIRAHALLHQGVKVFDLIAQMRSLVEKEHVSVASVWESFSVASAAAYVASFDEDFDEDEVMEISTALFKIARHAMGGFGAGQLVYERTQELGRCVNAIMGVDE